MDRNPFLTIPDLPLSQRCQRTGCERYGDATVHLDGDPRYPVWLCDEHAEWAEGRPRCPACRAGQHTNPGQASDLCTCGQQTCACFGRSLRFASRQGS